MVIDDDDDDDDDADDNDITSLQFYVAAKNPYYQSNGLVTSSP